MLCMLVQAQQVKSGRGELPEKAMPKKPLHMLPTQMRTGIISEWYNYGNMMLSAGGDVDYYRNFLFPDSTVQVNFSSGMGPVWKHSLGQVFDPMAPMWNTGGLVAIDSATPYSIDSIAIPYRYWRYQDAAPDTLVIQIYIEPAIELEPHPGWTSGASYASVGYNYHQRLGRNAVKTIHFPLTAMHQSTLNQGMLYVPVNQPVPAGQKMAATVTYMPGNPYRINDTIDTYTSFAITNRINAFVFYDYRDTDLYYEPLFYNNELAITSEERYNISTIGWNGYYIPGTAWGSGIYHGDIYFKMTAEVETVNSVDELQAGLDVSVFPNPVSHMLQIRSGQPVVQADIMDINGRKLISVDGAGITALDLAALPAGMYMLRLTNAHAQVSTHRLIKQ